MALDQQVSAKLQSDVIVERLHRLHPSLIDLSLNRIFELLDRLGNPQNELPTPVHVAGTNGKGSYLAFMQSICEAAGLVVHKYTSPHLVNFGERIIVAGKQISEKNLVDLLKECEAANAGQEITFFEISTAAAFLAFSRTKADVSLIETGLGGRFDATNVIQKPALTAITPISMDHMRFLGNTISAIAFEKAGILKPSVTSIIGPQDPAAMEIIENRANEIGAPLLRQGSEWNLTEDFSGLHLSHRENTLALPYPGLPGMHQYSNAGQAVVSILELFGSHIERDTIATGLETTKWPGRLQKLDEGKLVSLIPKGWELWIDGGHNQAAAEAILDFVEVWSDSPLVLIFGALNSRDPQDFLEILAPVTSLAVCITIPGEKSALQAHDCLLAAQSVGIEAIETTSVQSALKTAARHGTKGRILICGSLYLAGAVLAENGTPP